MVQGSEWVCLQQLKVDTSKPSPYQIHLNSNLAKLNLPISYTSVEKSDCNFAQSMAV